jgi:hypothetical protein
MRVLVCALALVVAAVPAIANPVWNDEMALEFDDGSNCAWPYDGQPVTVRVVLKDLSMDWEGVVGVSFRLERTFTGVLLDQRSLLGGDIWFGSVEEEGVVFVSPDCVVPSDGRVPVAEFDYMFLGDPGLLTVEGHASDGPAFADCSTAIRFWNTDLELNTVGFHVEPPGGCHGASPVGDASWGSIKALYR